MGRIKLVAFDLDGTLLRGDTVCLGIAKELGRYERMREIEAANDPGLRSEMADWYVAAGRDRVTHGLENVALAPGAEEGCRLLREHGVTIAIVSVTWSIAVEKFARQFGAAHHAATGLDWESGDIDHFFGRNKGPWLQRLMEQLNLVSNQVVAVGDTMNDEGLLQAAGLGICAGPGCMNVDQVLQRPNANILDLTKEILER
ncbi:MAG: HAD-IB family phosphatase [Chloroflexi bacterium]|nr:HAD-IB family phosphatase [Chloroflexota bacterium]